MSDIEAVDLKIAINGLKSMAGKKRAEGSKLINQADGILLAVTELELEFENKLNSKL